ncbi:iron-containing alcohol dehydrogenase family protein [Flindersiella endophytica]
MITTPVVVDVRHGAIADLAGLLADQRISAAGRVAIAVGASSGERLRGLLEPGLHTADFYTVPAGTVDAAVALADQVKGRSYDALVGVGGGKVLDVTKYTAARVGLPMVSVATNLAHDGIASPVSILDNDAGRGSYGVPAPIAIVVDLGLVREAPSRSVRAGIGEVLSNLSAITDWELSHEHTGEPIDGLAVTFARTAAEAVLHHPGTIDDDDFLLVLAEGLVLSGLAMVVAGSTRPCSGACHEISHAIDLLYPDRAGYHGEQVGLGAAFASYVRNLYIGSGSPSQPDSEDGHPRPAGKAEEEPGGASGDRRERSQAGCGGRRSPAGTGSQTLATMSGEQLGALTRCLIRHGLPVLPSDLGFSEGEFSRIVGAAPDTRPGRYTILEHLNLDSDGLHAVVKDYVRDRERPANDR